MTKVDNVLLDVWFPGHGSVTLTPDLPPLRLHQYCLSFVTAMKRRPPPSTDPETMYGYKSCEGSPKDLNLQCVSVFLAERFVFLGEEGLAFQRGAAHLRSNGKHTNTQQRTVT